MADSDDKLEPSLVKVIPLNQKKRKPNGDQNQDVQDPVEMASRKRLVPRTRRTMPKREGGKGIEQQENNQAHESQIEEHREDAEGRNEERTAEGAAKEDQNNKNQKVESLANEHGEAEGKNNATHKEEDHSDEKDNGHDTNDQDRKMNRLDDQSQNSTTRTKKTQNKKSVSGHGLFAHAVSTVTKLQSWWKGGKAVAEDTGHATKDSNQNAENPDDGDQEEENQVDKNQDDEFQNDKNPEQPFPTGQLPYDEPQQKEDLTPVALPDTPPSSPVAYRPTPAAFFPSYSVVHHSMPAVSFPPAQSSASDDADDDEDDKFLSKVFQVGREIDDDSEQEAIDIAQDDEDHSDEIEKEAKQDKVNRKDKLQKGENSSMDPSSSFTPAPTTTTTLPSAPLALHVKRKHSAVPTPGIATMVTRAAPMAFRFGAKPSPPPTSHGIEERTLTTPFADPSKYTPTLGSVWTGKTQPPYSGTIVPPRQKGRIMPSSSSSKEKREEAGQEPEPESDPEDRSPLTEDQMWEEMDKARRRLGEKKK
ncbi:hypothetical protein CBER1_10600 [Cercospora berteroae]|uniref:Uncharacterized protein n=1 Tax=Cercospora berteroae TaxID=357750 RepID=A0A2S6BYU8_9PEZI|nr:hypothetical protein CBER1_10600 [Cercospora berteroae]